MAYGMSVVLPSSCHLRKVEERKRRMKRVGALSLLYIVKFTSIQTSINITNIITAKLEVIQH